MNLNKKAASLHQSMESWIELYKTIHECGHNEAHDAFDEWAEKLEGESADQTSTKFHNAVMTSHAEMRKGFVEEHFPSGVVIFDKPVQRQVSYTDTSGKVHISKPVGDLLGDAVAHDQSVKKQLFAPGSMDRLVHIDDDIEIAFNVDTTKGPIGGPLIELSYGKQPDRYKVLLLDPKALPDYSSLTMKDEHNPQGPIGGPILDTGRDPLAFKEDDVANTREKAEKAIELNTSFLINTKHAPDHPSVIKAREILAASRSFLEMLDGVEQRAKERQGRTLSLKGKK